MNNDRRQDRPAEIEALTAWRDALSARWARLLDLRIALLDLEQRDDVTAGAILTERSLRAEFLRIALCLRTEERNLTDALVHLAGADAFAFHTRTWPALTC